MQLLGKSLSVLIIDLRNAHSSEELYTLLPEQWKKAKKDTKFLKVKFVRSEEAAIEIINHEQVIGIALATSNFTTEVEAILQAFHRNSGYLQEFQLIINSQPDPWMMANFLEYGVDRFCSDTDWIDGVYAWSQDIVSILETEGRPELAIFQLTRDLKTGNDKAIEEAMNTLNKFSPDDPQASFARGLFEMSTNRIRQAMDSLGKASQTSRFFRTASLAYSQTLIAGGQAEQAVAILQRLQKTNPKFGPILLNLVGAYSALGQLDKAKEALKELSSCDLGDDSAIAIASIRLYFAEDRFDEAIALVSKLTNLSKQDISFLIKCGLTLTKRNLPNFASRLYRQAHKASPDDEKYRVSLNAALSAYHFKEYDLALMYLSRAKDEQNCDESEISSVENAIQSAVLKRTA